MGGNALSAKTIRLDKDLYDKAVGFVLSRINPVLPKNRKALIPAYASKKDFGDMDILIGSSSDYDPNALAAAIHATEVVRNGDVTSCGLRFHTGIFQVDFIKVPDETFDFALRYFAMNDLGNLLGRIAHKAGFKLGHKGLLYPLRAGDDHVIAELVVTTDWNRAIELLGYDATAYNFGLAGEFRSPVNLFAYTASSPYFNKQIYLLENRNNKSRVRDKKRKTYMDFLEWLRVVPDNAVPEYNWSDKDEVQREFLGMAFDKFPLFHKSYVDAIEQYQKHCEVAKKFNGQLVYQWTGLRGRELGRLICAVKDKFEAEGNLHRTRVQFEDWVLSSTEEEKKVVLADCIKDWAARKMLKIDDTGCLKLRD